jgi:spoIIIJ-associated protein
MLSQETINKIKEITRDFFEKTTLSVEIEFLPEKEGVLPINIKSEEPQILIGEGGQTLIEIQHLLKLVLKKKIIVKNEPLLEGQKEDFRIDLDINNYKKKKADYLKETAISVADNVSLAKKEKELAPMPPYERRIIHLALADRTDVIAESIGEEPERRIIIKPKP